MHGHATAGTIGLWLLALSLAMPAAAGGTNSGAPSAVCRSKKLEAAGQYYLCLLRADQDQARHDRCDLRFARAFERADQISPGCEPLDDLVRTQDGVREHAQAVLNGDLSQPPCETVTTDGAKVICRPFAFDRYKPHLSSSINLQRVLSQLNGMAQDQCAPCSSVTGDTVLWLQAWGGEGGFTPDRGPRGFAQTVTSINDLIDRGYQNLHFYLGEPGRSDGSSGTVGGASTIITGQDLTSTPDQGPDLSKVLLIAGGGGGAGGFNLTCVLGRPPPGHGGAGGVAIATTGSSAGGAGSAGGRDGGQGGHRGAGGSGVYGGRGLCCAGGRGGLGGQGASSTANYNSSWINANLTFTAGQGQGGGNSSKSCTTGGGGSFARISTRSDADAPTTRQPTPGLNLQGAGLFQLVFNTDPS